MSNVIIPEIQKKKMSLGTMGAIAGGVMGATMGGPVGAEAGAAVGGAATAAATGSASGGAFGRMIDGAQKGGFIGQTLDNAGGQKQAPQMGAMSRAADQVKQKEAELQTLMAAEQSLGSVDPKIAQQAAPAIQRAKMMAMGRYS